MNSNNSLKESVDIRHSWIYFFLVVSLISILTIFASLAVFIGLKSLKSPPRSGLWYPSLIQNEQIVGYSWKPNINIDYPFGINQHYRIYTDAKGVRVFSPSKPVNNESIIVAIGDSQTFGQGVSLEQTYISKTGTKLKVDVDNLAVSGYGTVSALLLLERFQDLKPKIVILGHYYDHPRRSLSRCYPGFSFSCMSVPYVKLQAGKEIEIVLSKNNANVISKLREYNDYISGHGDVFSFGLDFYWTSQRLYADYVQSTEFLFDRISPTLENEKKVTDFLYGRLAKLGAKKGFNVIIVYIPNYFGTTVEPSPAYLAEAAEKYNFSLVDMTHDFQVALDKSNDSIVIPNDGHINEQGHELISNRLTSLIKSNSKFREILFRTDR